MHVANSLVPLHFSLGLASTKSSTKEVDPRSGSSTKSNSLDSPGSSTESDSLDSHTERLLRHFGRDYRTGGMSNPNIPDPNDDRLLEMPLNISALQATGPNAEIVNIEDDSPDRASEAQKESEFAEEKDDEAEELAAEDDFAEGETVGASSSQVPAEQRV